MSGSDSFQRDSQQSAGLSLNLSSNNPFRNRAASPASPFDDPPPRPVSRNPFLDNPPPLRSPDAMSNSSDHKSMSAEEIFNSLTLDDRRPSVSKQPLVAFDVDERPREENVPPEGSHPKRSEELLKNRRMPPPPGAGARPGPSASPSRRPPQQRRPRRNSDSSVREFDTGTLTEEEKRMIAKRRERERRHRESRAVTTEEREDRESKKEDADKSGKDRERREGKSSRSSKPFRPSRRMDIIDQLDATSIYGMGLFHHDGPFDALNPHRNKNSSRRAPMHAFPKDSLNNSIAGGPLNKNADHSTFLGQANDEAFRDYAQSAKDKRPGIFDPISRGEVVHGDESVGLGTSTFLEGTPATKTAIERHHKEHSQEIAETELRRGKSLAHRIRGINRGPREARSGVDATFGSKRSPESAGAIGESNPFFAEYSKGEDNLTVKPRDETSRQASPPRRRRGSGNPLERRATTDATPSEDSSKPSGLLGRMKSLKGGKRSRNVDPPVSPPAATPGTAI